MKTMNFEGRVALVTGASSGIGLAVARELVKRRSKVALVARTQANLDAAVRDLGPDKSHAFALDVTDREALLKLPGEVKARFGRLDFVVNNAGVNHRGPVASRTAAELTATLETNLLAPILLTQAALEHLSSGSVVVNVASLAGKVPVPDEATYSASKAGLRAFSRALHIELEERSIRVATVCPGPVDTGFFGDIDHVPNLVFSQPMSTAEEVADAVLRAIEGEAQEIDVPALSGKLATLGYLSPSVFKRLRPIFERRGARNKAAYIAGRKKR
jgi:short-subunit dehydrogenase